MKYFKQTLLAVALSVMGCFSSCNYLNVDDYFVDTFNYDSIFANKLNLERYLWATASSFPDEGAILGSSHTPGSIASDELFVQWRQSEFNGMQYVLGNINADNMPWNKWSDMYKIIRKANTILLNMDKPVDLDQQTRNKVLGYTYFIRAYAYYHILVDFGPAVLIGDDILETNEKPEYYNAQRATYDETMEYVCSEFEKAAQFMPGKNMITISQFGRPSRDAALALVARLRLMHASNAFNGGSAARRWFGDWTRKSDGVHYVSQTADPNRWGVAAHAAARLLNSGYELHTVKRDTSSASKTPDLPLGVSDLPFPEGAGDIDPLRSYTEMFNGEGIAYKNPEYIWGRNSGSIQNYTRHSFPVGNLGGWGGMCVQQKIVDAYYMEDGIEYKDANVDEAIMTNEPRMFSGYQQNGGISKMYDKREMRFYASIGFNRCFWPMGSTEEANKFNITTRYDFGGDHGKNKSQANPDDWAITGYVLKKYIHPDDAWAGSGATRLTKSFPIIRYAEILLSYVEALNNLGSGSVTIEEDGVTYTYTRNDAEIVKYFNQIRFRAGLPGIKPGLTQDEINDLIIRERMIEFLGENRRYYDVRRWGIYETVDAEPITGMNADVTEKDGYYQRVVVNHIYARTRLTTPKLVLLPLKRSELRKAPTLDQNPGWD